MDYDKKKTGAAIQAQRRTLGLTQEKLAEILDCSLRHMVDIERGVAGMSIDILMKICCVLKTTPNDLLLPSAEEELADSTWLADVYRQCSPSQRQALVELTQVFLRYVARA